MNDGEKKLTRCSPRRLEPFREKKVKFFVHSNHEIGRKNGKRKNTQSELVITVNVIKTRRFLHPPIKLYNLDVFYPGICHNTPNKLFTGYNGEEITI